MKLCMGCMNQMEDHLSTCPHCGFNEITMRQESYYLDPGTIVGGKYIVGRVLSYGGHTVSYLGMDAERNRKVIVKEYLPSDFSTRSEGETEVTIYSGDGQEQFEQGLTNFLNEANRIQQLGGAEGIAAVYDCVAENETGYVISEYVEGHTLKEILDSGKKYSEEEALGIIRKILQGLSKVHEMDIIHCDIAPETITVTNAGDIKLTDFGATRYVTTANSKSLSIILKRGYAPEEQYRSKGKRGPWTDVYAIGAVMYRMLTGVVPQESVERALTDDLKEPSKMGVSISPNVENALMNALNVYQDVRTPSAKVFLQELNSDNVKRIKVKQRKNKTGKFPIWAKGLVACLVCVTVVGGVYVVKKMSGTGADTLNSKAITMQDLRGKTWEEAQAYVEKLNKENSGWNIQLQAERTVFDLTEENGTVCSQSIEPGKEIYDPEKEVQDAEVAGLYYDSEGNVSGEIVCKIYSNEIIRYDEISDLNAYELAKKLDIDTEGDSFIEEEGNDNTQYFDLACLEVNGEKYSSDALQKEKNQEKEISYSKEDIKIHYYAADFFYWKKLPDFAEQYGQIDQVPEQDVYRYINEKQKETTGTKSLTNSNLVKDDYYAVGSKYSKGQIVGQTVAAGEEYDESNPSDNPLEIQVIGNIFSYKGKTGAQFVKEITTCESETEDGKGFGLYGFMTASGGTGNKDWYVTDVKVYKADDNGGHTDEELKYFEWDGIDGRNVYFVIIVEKPQPKTEASSTWNGSGNSAGGSSAPSGSGKTGNSKSEDHGW